MKSKRRYLYPAPIFGLLINEGEFFCEAHKFSEFEAPPILRVVKHARDVLIWSNKKNLRYFDMITNSCERSSPMNFRNLNRISMIVSGVIALALITSAASAGTCSSTISYRNGQYLKSGSTFYFDNGQYLKSGSTLYHANGQYLKSGSTFYYANGQYFRSGSTLYHQNGQYLRSGSTWYYQNGQYLKSGSTFYHQNGQYARSGSSLYRDDGSRTEFPVTLKASLGSPGYVQFVVDKTSDSSSFHLDGFVDNNLVTAKLEVSGDSFTTLFSINTGYTGEYVNLVIDSNGNLESCATSGGQTGPTQFRLDSRAATIDVTVKSGHDSAEVRKVLQEALNSLD